MTTYRASDKCHHEKRKTITGDDLLWAMANLGFDQYIEPLRLYLQRYREVIITPFKLFILFIYLCLLRMLFKVRNIVKEHQEMIYRIPLLL